MTAPSAGTETIATAACDYRTGDANARCGRPAVLRLTSPDGMVVELCGRHGTDSRRRTAERAGWRIEAVAARLTRADR
jgi:hypothetical protein